MSSTVQSSLIEQLQKKCRFWKRLAVTALSVLVLGFFFGFLYVVEQAAYYREEIEGLRSGSNEAGDEQPDPLNEPIPIPDLPGTAKKSQP
jgi:hypothetical protein